VLARMPPRSINRTAAVTKITLSPQSGWKISDFRTVAHENHGIKGKRRKGVVALTAPIRGRRHAFDRQSDARTAKRRR
jgi:hypothetical protein